jgi:hypothetical protein
MVFVLIPIFVLSSLVLGLLFSFWHLSFFSLLPISFILISSLRGIIPFILIYTSYWLLILNAISTALFYPTEDII